MAQDIADFLESRRTEKKMTKQQFAKFLGIASSYYGRIISKKRGVSKGAKQHIIKALNLEGQDLTNFEDMARVSGVHRPDRSQYLDAEELKYLSRIAEVAGPLSFDLILSHLRLYRARQ